MCHVTNIHLIGVNTKKENHCAVFGNSRGHLIYQHITSFTHICQKCHMVVDSGFACITGCSLYLHMFTRLQKYHSLPLALLCMFLTSVDCCEMPLQLV